MDRTGRPKRNSSFRDCYGKRRFCVTVIMLGGLISVVLLAYAAFASTPSDASIQQVILVFRHGDRTPTETYPLDPYLHYNWPGGWGALTEKGMLQLYNVGRWIREEYGELIGKTYRSNLAEVQSSYADRCIMSAQALLAGLYPPQPHEMFHPNLPWRPVPVHSTPRNLDKVIVVKAPCPRLEEALKEAYINETRQSGSHLANYYAALSTHTGQNISTITDVEFLYNTLEIEEQHGLKLPRWTKEYYNQEMRDIAARSLAIFTSNILQRRLRGGPLLKEIVNRLESFRSGTDKRIAYLYSAHDITLVNLLRTMGFVDNLLKPDYGATLIFELHSVHGGNDYQVKVRYLRDTAAAAASLMEIPKCRTPCLLGNLIDAWEYVTPDNWEEECKLR